MIRRPGNSNVNNKKVALALLIYTCLFVFDDTPFTSFWDNLPMAEVEQLVCAEEQEESLAIVALIKTGLRTVSNVRHSIPPEPSQSIITRLISTNSSFQIRSHLAISSVQRKRSIDFCVFQI